MFLLCLLGTDHDFVDSLGKAGLPEAREFVIFLKSAFMPWMTIGHAMLRCEATERELEKPRAADATLFVMKSSHKHAQMFALTAALLLSLAFSLFLAQITTENMGILGAASYILFVCLVAMVRATVRRTYL